MEMRQIRYFLAAAEELNFTRAAEKCNVSQPTLTRAMILLEGELGGELFRRERNLTHLTDLGKRLLPILSKTIEHADDAARLAESFRSLEVANLNLALPNNVPLDPFIPHLVELTKTFADFEFKVKRGTIPELTTMLKEGNADILLAPAPSESWDRFEHWPLYRCSFNLVLRDNHPLAKNAVVRAEHLQGASVLQRRYCDMRNELEAYLAKANVTLQSAPEFSSDDDIMTYLSCSKSIGFLPCGCNLRENLVTRSVEGLDAGFDLQAITIAGRRRGAALSLFLTQLRAANWQAAAA